MSGSRPCRIHALHSALFAASLAIAALPVQRTDAAADAPSLPPIQEVSPDRLDQPYERVVLNLEGAGPKGKGMEVTIGILGGRPVQIWALSPVWGCQRLISRTGSLQTKAGRIQGTCYVLISNPYSDKAHTKSYKHGGAWWGFEIEATRRDGVITGSYAGRHSNPTKREPSSASGKVTGRVVTREQLNRRHPLKDMDYPYWRGESGSGSTPDTGYKLVEDFANATVMWASEESELPGTYNIVMGGLGGPVVKDGLVYLSYQMPNGPDFDEEWYKKIMPEGCRNHEIRSFYGHVSGEYGAQWLRRRVSIQADDVVLCVDAQTGLTVWKRVWPAVARNPSYSSRGWSWAKNGPYTTPCVADGKLYTLGGHGAIYCLDARTGKTIWIGGLPSSKNATAHLKDAVQAGRMVQRVKRKPSAPDYVTSLLYADGVIVASDNGWNVCGYDAKTGRVLWGGVRIDGLGHGRGGGAHSGVRMVLGGRELVMMGPALLDPRTGNVLWQVGEKYFRGELGNPCVSDDIVVFANGTRNRDSNIGLSAWRLTPQGEATLLWSLDDNYCTTGFQTPAIYEGHLYCCTRPADRKRDGDVICVELETGKIVAKADRRRGEGSIACLLASDNRLLVGQQGGSWWRADPENFARLSEFPGGDSQPNNQSSHPQAMCGGRLYSRGDFNLVCWDLRRTRGPEFSPPGGKQSGPVRVRIEHDAPNGVIRYAFDGAEPTEDSPVYKEPLRLDETRIIKARVYRPGIAPSETEQAVYYFGQSDRAVRPEISPAAGTHTQDITVQMETPTRYATIRYTLDGSEPTASSKAYTEPFILAKSTTLKARTFCGYLPNSDAVTVTYKIDRQPFVESDGRIVMEAENFFSQKQAESHRWQVAAASGASEKAIDAQPDEGKKFRGKTRGPRLDYPLLVQSTGPWYVWVRWRGRSSSSDSLYVGLDRKSAGEYGNHGGEFVWQRLGGNNPKAIKIGKPGQHTFHIWMREDGTLVDKIVLTQARDWKPLLPHGPAESRQK